MIYCVHWFYIGLLFFSDNKEETRGPKGHISCTWEKFASFVDISDRAITFFSIGPKINKTNVRGHAVLAPCEVSLNSVLLFQTESQKCISLSEIRVAILVVQSTQKHTLDRGRWDLTSCQVSLNSVQRQQKSSRKCLNQSNTTAVILVLSID